jgi:hypothetical protein
VLVAAVLAVVALASVGGWVAFRPHGGPGDPGAPGAPVVDGQPDAAGEAPVAANRAPDAGDTAFLAGQRGVEAPAGSPLLFANATVTVTNGGFLSWAVMDRRSGELWGSANLTETTWPASMIKAWIAADFLRRASESGTTPDSGSLNQVEIMIRDSDNNAAISLHSRNGGSASIRRMISMCGLTDTSPSTAGGWSFTNISAQDTVRVADCIADGVAAGPQWTSWLLEKMRAIRIGGWGIRDGVPAGEAGGVSIKNGWLRYDDDGLWHINCLAVSETWAMAVLQRYAGTGNWNRDFLHGQTVCRDVAVQLTNPAYAYAH